jgi:hypothetical protein
LKDEILFESLLLHRGEIQHENIRVLLEGGHA